MSELLAWLQQVGFSIPDLRLDNQIHRFSREGRDKNCWYIGEWVRTSSGKEFPMLTVADYATDEKYTYVPKGDFNAKEIEEVKARQAEQNKAKAAEKKARQLEVAALSDRLYRRATPRASHPYLEKKGVFRCGDFRVLDGTLLIPLRAVGSDTIENLQRILPTGEKRFLAGGKKTGLAYCFRGTDPSRIYLCEGLATGFSISRALGEKHHVVVAFDAGNLEPVAKELRKHYPSSRLDICADNDQFGKKNVGVIKATAAATKHKAAVIVPFFKNHDTKPTDFNDLHLLEGLEEVRKQLAYDSPGLPPSEQEDEPQPLEPDAKRAIELTNSECIGGSGGGISYLGFNGGDYFYTSPSNQDIVRLGRSSHTATNLLDLMPYEYWEQVYGEGKKTGVTINWLKAASDMMEKCRAAGVFDGKRVRGAGAWTENGELTLHLGNRIWKGGCKSINEHHATSEFVYKLGSRKPAPHPHPLSSGEASRLIRGCGALSWRYPQSAILFAGYLAIFRICGALSWRPHAWLSGPAGTGKSTIMEYLAKPMAGSWAVYVVGSTTEAGVRQAIGSNSVPVLFDEAETTNTKSGNRIKSILELARQASSDSEARIFRGTPDGKGYEFKVNCSFFLSSIRVNLTEEADISRFCVLEITRSKAPWSEIEPHLQFDNEYGERLFSRMVGLYGQLRESIRALETVLSTGYTQRTAQQYAPILAGYHLLQNDTSIGVRGAEELVKDLNLTQSSVEDADQDELECLMYLLGNKVTVERPGGGLESMSIEQLLLCTIANDAYASMLSTYGLAVHGEKVSVATGHPELKKLFRDSKWDGLWQRSLIRLPGAASSRQRFTPGGRAFRCVQFPTTLLG